MDARQVEVMLCVLFVQACSCATVCIILFGCFTVSCVTCDVYMYDHTALWQKILLTLSNAALHSAKAI